MLALSADMDESSSLLDLLECSVCLERLDTTARVLPCQHTFCRRCLENIVSSRNELRCPECRILVDCGVDDLPANILLVRLLDGIRQRPQRGSGGGGVGAGGRLSLVAGGSLHGYAAGLSASPPGSAVRELPVATRSSPVKMEMSLMNMHAVPEISALKPAVAAPSHLALCFSFSCRRLSLSHSLRQIPLSPTSSREGR
uniref:RING-type domain-containing protein n=1 Tax=Scophthalmus maximus TaxID=52904 RepID=A0A8D3CV98_SCOMX